MGLIKADESLRTVPTVVFTTSAAQEDITKPGDLDGVITAESRFTGIASLQADRHGRDG